MYRRRLLSQENIKSKRIRKLTPSLLRKMVMQERKRIMRETSDPVSSGIVHPEKVSPDEVDADKLADTLEKDIDHMKALKIHEKRLKKKLVRIAEAKKKIRTRVLRRIR